jgi:hypothetical protein
MMRLRRPTTACARATACGHCLCPLRAPTARARATACGPLPVPAARAHCARPYRHLLAIVSLPSTPYARE